MPTMTANTRRRRGCPSRANDAIHSTSRSRAMLYSSTAVLGY
jgi:hypothetical protein